MRDLCNFTSFRWLTLIIFLLGVLAVLPSPHSSYFLSAWHLPIVSSIATECVSASYRATVVIHAHLAAVGPALVYAQESGAQSSSSSQNAVPAVALPGAAAASPPDPHSEPPSGKAAAPGDAKPPADSPSADNQRAEITVNKHPIHTTPIQVDVNMVVVNVTVTDPYDRIVTGLDQANFAVFDEKVSQKIEAFSTEDAPISVGMVFDSSGSMSDKIQKSREAALQFFKTSNPQDEFMLINFSERPNLISAFTSKFENLQDHLIVVKAGGKTALLDAIYLGLSEMKKGTTNRKALLVISDGGDNHSRYTERDLKKAVKEGDVEIYCVGIFEPLASRARTPEEAGGPGLLADLAEISGGRMFSVEDPNELPDIMEKISIELRNQYIIGYKPSNLVRDGRWRRVKVKLLPPRGLPPLQVYARTGYYAPTQ
jgi:Ca-activated chloride channel family protein